uniref:PAS domain-containing protein n=1 Tax=Acrobeloides nanus TaxID=290746 RepID=A0A914DYA1_9BILA
MQLAICILSGIGEFRNAVREALTTTQRPKRAVPSGENVEPLPLSVENQQQPQVTRLAAEVEAGLPPLATTYETKKDTRSVERVATEKDGTQQQAEDPLVPPHVVDDEMTEDGEEEETNKEPPQHYYMQFKPYEWQSEVMWTESEYKSKFATFIRRMPDANVMANMTFSGFAYHMDRLAKTIEEEIHFQYLEDKERFMCYITNDNILSLELSDQLAYILGYSTPEIQNNSISNYPIDLQGGMDSLFIYAPGLVQPSIVSDALAPLLRIVVVRGALGDIAKGDQPKEAIKVHTREGLHNLMSKAANKLQSGSGRRPKKKKKRQTGRGSVVHTYSPVKARRKRSRHSMSGDSGERSIEVFTIDPTNISINKSGYRELIPQNTVTQEGPFEFHAYSDNQWFDLAKVYVSLVFSIDKKEGSEWKPIEKDKDKDIGVVQTLGQSFFEVVKVFV